MRGATNSTSIGFDDYPPFVKLKIWWKTGTTFEELFSTDRSTFASVKYAALRYFQEKIRSDSTCRMNSYSLNNRNNFIPSFDADNFKLISIATKRVMDDRKTLSQTRTKDGDEFLLSTRLISKLDKASDLCLIDEHLIELRTAELPRAKSRSFTTNFRFSDRTEFRADLNSILITLIETSQKLLWCHPDAENIFKQAEEILLNSSAEDQNEASGTSNDYQMRQDLICKLMEMGFTQQQSQLALKRTNNTLHAAMELLLVEPDLIESETDSNETLQISSNVRLKPLFTRDGPFVSFQHYRQQRFQPNLSAIRSLKDMGFDEESIVDALRKFNNDENLACEYLLADREQRETIVEANSDTGLDPNSNIVRSILENPVVQRTLNNPKTFFVMLKILANPRSLTNYLNDPDIGNMLLQISRIYHTERDETSLMVNHRSTNEIQDRIPQPVRDRISGDFDNHTV